MELKSLSRQDIVSQYSFPLGKQEEIGVCWFMSPLQSQLKTFKNGLGKLTYFKTIERDLNDTPYDERFETKENMKPIMYEMITDYILFSDYAAHQSSESEDDDESGPKLFKVDGFDDCYLGIGDSYGEMPALIYDKQKILEKLQQDGMDEDEAKEFFEFNILGTYLGEKMPIFLDRIPLDELD